MTATPIPRSVTMTLFGDLDVSTLRDSPPGRQEIHTYLTTEDLRDRWWKFFAEKLREGRQGYVITPLVEESDQDRGKERGRGLRGFGQRTLGRIPPGPDSRPHVDGLNGRFLSGAQPFEAFAQIIDEELELKGIENPRFK